MINIEEFTFLSSDGQTRLHAMLWLPEGEIRGILQIAHGVAEHAARYDGFARYLCARGISVAGHDHLGHGKSLPSGATPVYFGAQDGWQHAVDDIHALHQRLQEEFPNMPLCIMGHSMGSFLTRSYLIRYPGTVRAAVIMGTGWQPAPVIAAGRTLAKLIARREGADATSDLVTKLAFGGYNKAFAPNRTDFDWLSADEGNVDRYIADPMCGADATVGLFLDMLGGISFNQKITNLRKMDHELPVLFVSGDKDPVGQMGKGVQHSFEAFLAAGVKDVSIRLYSGLRHEILNETAQQETIYKDIGDWLDTKI